MKHLLAALCGLLSISAAQACNWTGENCSFSIYEEASRQVGNLKQNPKFMQEKFNELMEKAKYIDRKAASCSNWKCVNDTAFEYSSYVSKLTLAYMNTSKPAAVAAPAPVQDKWSGQCVIAKRAGISAFVDQSATAKINTFNANATWTVTTANGGDYVGISTVPDYDKPDPNAGAGKFVGWVKKSDLQMQDLRNCN